MASMRRGRRMAGMLARVVERIRRENSSTFHQILKLVDEELAKALGP